MKALNEAQVKQAMVLKPFFPLIQAYMNEHVKGPAPVSSTKVYDALKGQLDGMEQEKFQPALSLAVRGELISGFAGRKGRYGGYIPAGMADSPDDDSSDSEETEGGEAEVGLDFGNGFMLVGADANNWKLIRPSGPPHYFTSLERAALRTADMVQDATVKGKVKAGQVKNQNELLACVRQCRDDIAAMIRDGLANKARSVPPVPAASE